MAGIIAAYNSKKDEIWDRFNKSYDRIETEADLRDERIEKRKDLSLSRKNVRNQFQLGLIETDLEHCITRVNSN